MTRSLELACESGSLEVALKIVEYLDGEQLKTFQHKLSCKSKNLYHLIVKNKRDHSGGIGLLFGNVMSKLIDPTRQYLTARERSMNVLHMAISNRHYDIIKILVESTDFDSLNRPTGDTAAESPVHLAAKFGSKKCFELLSRVDIRVRTGNGNNLLHVAVAHRQHEFIRYLISRSDIYNEIEHMAAEKNGEYMYPLELAVFMGNLEEARVVEVRTNWNFVDFGTPLTLFHECVKNGRLDGLEYLFGVLDKKFGVNLREKEDFIRMIVSMVSGRNENTIFHMIALRNQSDMMKFLLDKCNFELDQILLHRNRDELTCFHITCIQGN